MSYKVLLVGVLVFPLSLFAQTGARNSSDNAMAQPSSPSPIGSRFPTGNGLAWYGGTVGYAGEGPAGGVMLSTPTAGFDSPQPTAGISDAGRAGISNSAPINPEVQSSATNSTLVYSNLPEIQPESPMTASPATAAVSATPASSDFGPSYFSNEGGGRAEAVNGLSLAEIAERYRNAQGTQIVRTYTNSDVRPAGNVSEAERVLLARNTPPGAPQSAASAAGTEVASNNGSSSNLPQNNGPQPPEQKSAELPASATLLPLLGLLGLMSGGLGLCLMALGRRRSLQRG